MQPPEQGEEEEEIAEEVSHNPEPPEEAEEEPQSTISPALLLRNLRILIPSRANSVPEPKDDEPAESPRDHPVTTADREEAACLLWDMSVDAEQAKLLAAHHGLDILEYWIIARAAQLQGETREDGSALNRGDDEATDRLAEAAVGVFANVSSASAELAAQIASRETLQTTLVDLLYTSECPQLLTEVARLICAGLAPPAPVQATSAWLKMLASEGIISRLCFLLAVTLHFPLHDRLCSLLELITWHWGRDGASSSNFSYLGEIAGVVSELLKSEIGLLVGEKGTEADVEEPKAKPLLRVLEALGDAEALGAVKQDAALINALLRLMRLPDADELRRSAANVLSALLDESPLLDADLIGSVISYIMPILTDRSALEVRSRHDDTKRELVSAVWTLLGVCAITAGRPVIKRHFQELLDVAQQHDAKRLVSRELLRDVFAALSALFRGQEEEKRASAFVAHLGVVASDVSD